jgi:hypothetical protein
MSNKLQNTGQSCVEVRGGAVSFSDYKEFCVLADKWTDNLNAYNVASNAAGEYVKNNTGATKTIMDLIFNQP